MICVYSSERNALANSAKNKTTTTFNLKKKATQEQDNCKTEHGERDGENTAAVFPADAVCEWKCTLYANVVAIYGFFLIPVNVPVNSFLFRESRRSSGAERQPLSVMLRIVRADGEDERESRGRGKGFKTSTMDRLAGRG